MKASDDKQRELLFWFYPDLINPSILQAVADAESTIRFACERLKRDANGHAGFLLLPSDETPLLKITEVLGAIKERFRRVLVLGIGGSSLGIEAALRALDPIPKAPESREVRVLSNVDPDSVHQALLWFDPQDTLLVVISKSGTTVETLVHLGIFLDRILKAGGEQGVHEGVIFITGQHDNPMRKLAKRFDCITFDIPNNVGGRYSVLTPVGLFPLALAGYDVWRLVDGAGQVFDALNRRDILSHPSVLSASIHHHLLINGFGCRVTWIYRDRFDKLGAWFAQLWAESLGKKRADHPVGQTPITAIGSVDQHSLLQLCMEGPNDKVFTFITLGCIEYPIEVPDLSEIEPIFLEFAKKQVGEVLDALAKGTIGGLAKAQRPILRIHIPLLDEATLGALFGHFELETALCGYLLGINPFDQPGVELGKRYAHGLLGKEGFESYKKELEAILGG